jgi:hypothetical protein
MFSLTAADDWIYKTEGAMHIVVSYVGIDDQLVNQS